MRAWAGIVLALLAGGVLFFVTENDDVAGELTSLRQSVYEIRPGDGIGPVEIGMSRAEAARAMTRTGHAVDTFKRWPKESPPVLAMQGNSFQVYFDRADRVNGIEVMGPTSDGQHEGLEPEFTARYEGVDVFRTPAKRLVEVVSRRAGAKPVVTEAGSTLTFPALGIALWRMVVEDTPYFETVVVDPPKRPRS